MNIIELEKYLETYYHIGFCVNQTESGIEIYPSSFNNDGFHILLEIENDIRLIAKAEPQKYGASILKLIEKSSAEKRKYCCEISKLLNAGELFFLINEKRKNANDFLCYSGEWSNFSICFVQFPFKDEKLIFEVAKTLISMFLSLLNYSIEGFSEGEKEQILSYKYERNPINRDICLNAKGYKCLVCGFDFEKKYGKTGRNIIEVHHTTPVSKMGENYIVDPVNELVPVCSNCHTIIHKRKIPYSIEEVKTMIKEADDGTTKERS